jgi:hypothetical protein
MKPTAFLLASAAAVVLAGCSSWGRQSLPRPPQRSLDEQVEARQKADAETKECVLRQSVRRQQIELGRGARPFPKEKC